MSGAGSKSMLVLLVVGIWFVFGCGTDPLDQIGHSYYIEYVSIKDRGNPTPDIDLWQDCPGGDEGAVTNANMDLTFRSAAGATQGAWVYRIRIDYRLDDFYNDVATPFLNIPAIPARILETDAVPVPAEGGTTTQAFPLLTVLQKEHYIDWIGDAFASIATFEVTITAYFTFTPLDPKNDYSATYVDYINLTNWADGSCE